MKGFFVTVEVPTTVRTTVIVYANDHDDAAEKVLNGEELEFKEIFTPNKSDYVIANVKEI